MSSPEQRVTLCAAAMITQASLILVTVLLAMVTGQGSALHLQGDVAHALRIGAVVAALLTGLCAVGIRRRRAGVLRPTYLLETIWAGLVGGTVIGAVSNGGGDVFSVVAGGAVALIGLAVLYVLTARPVRQVFIARRRAVVPGTAPGDQAEAADDAEPEEVSPPEDEETAGAGS